MFELGGQSPLANNNSPQQVSHEEISIREETSLGVAKLVTRCIAPKSIDAFARKANITLPHKTNVVAHAGAVDIACVAPGEWLIIGAKKSVENFEADLSLIIESFTALLLPLTYARSSFVISGKGARQVLSAVCPLDLHPTVFSTEMCARSLLGDVGVFIQQVNDQPEFRVIIEQPDASYVWRLLYDAGEAVI
ncbi:MAG: hypothetical protein COA47_07125 [Robiginitomaculum sp.]|nr:MAG: hypothetical protein COA47_07125 [Robiginitomaculum sp.]